MFYQKSIPSHSFPFSSVEDAHKRFQEGKSIILFDEVTCDFYLSTKLLEGRGQPGMAGFFRKYHPNTPEHLVLFIIKEDDPATCLAEGTAFPPFDFLADALVCAKVATLKKLDGHNAVISIQKAFVPESQDQAVTGLDQFIFGEKRTAKTPISKEKLHHSVLKNFLASIALSTTSIENFVKCIFASQILGDESLHTGQFMVRYNSRNTPQTIGRYLNPQNIIQIVKVDFGARERFAWERIQKNEHALYMSSKFYVSSSHQLGKDYLSYIIDNNELKKNLRELWAQVSTKDVQKVGSLMKKTIQNQLDAIQDQNLKSIAIQKLYQATGHSKDPQHTEDPTHFADVMEFMIINRMLQYLKHV